jgi:branched-chain amino acid transport system permease protein
MAITPEQFSLMHALIYVGAIIIGGMGSIPGVFFGVTFLQIIDELVLYGGPKLAETFPWIGSAPAASLGVTAFGLVLIVFLIFEPRGLAHSWETFKASYRLYPFKS